MNNFIRGTIEKISVNLRYLCAPKSPTGARDPLANISASRIHSSKISNFLKEQAKNSDLVEIGFRGQASIDRAFVSMLSGAKSYRFLGDHNIPNAIGKQVEDLAYQLHVQDRLPLQRVNWKSGPSKYQKTYYWNGQASDAFTIDSNLFEPDIKNKVGSVEITMLFGTIFHQRDPMRWLKRLRHLDTKFVLIEWMLTKPFHIKIGGEWVDFKSESAWCAESVNEAQATALSQYWRNETVNLQQFDIFPGPLNWATHHQQDSYWWWFFGKDAIHNLLADCGFCVVQSVDDWESRIVMTLCCKTCSNQSAA